MIVIDEPSVLNSMYATKGVLPEAVKQNTLHHTHTHAGQYPCIAIQCNALRFLLHIELNA